MATEPIQGGPYPVPADPPDGPNQMSAIVTWAAPRTVMRFAGTTQRDAAITSAVDGMECWTGAGPTARRWVRFNGTWVDVTPVPTIGTVTAGASITLAPSTLRLAQGLVTWQFTAARTIGPMAEGDSVATIPEGFRPPVSMPLPCMLSDGTWRPAGVIVQADGAVTARLNGVTGVARVAGTVTWLNY